MLKTGIITQARTTSTRLPGKIFLKANGIPVISHHVKRLAWSGIPIYIATTTNSTDQIVEDFANAAGIDYYRGDEHNVLERFYNCALKFKLDIIIRVTSDCPLIDGHVIADGLKNYIALNNPNVYYSNCLKRSFPRGMDFEIFSFDLLKNAYENASEDADKEHVTPFINQNKSGNVILKHHLYKEDHSDLRWTLDTEDDWNLLKLLLENYKASELSNSEIIKIVEASPELKNINNHIKQKEVKL